MYRAVIKRSTNFDSKNFDNLIDAESWIDSELDDYDTLSYIQELDENLKVVDWFYYTI